MSDKNWMLNPTAIAHARVCIAVIQEELGVKLKLSHPQFLEMIKDYIEMTDSDELATAYNALVSMAGSQLQAVATEAQKVVNLNPPTQPAAQATSQPAFKPAANTISSQSAAKTAETNSNTPSQEMIEYKGKLYPRFSDEGEFKGLYRGQPRYA